MPWCKLESTFRTEAKLYRLARRLNIRRAEARGLYAGLLSWASEHAPDGDLSDLDPGDIEDACDWEGEPNLVKNELVAVGLLDQDEQKGTCEIHKYWERASSYNEAKKKRKQRQNKKRVGIVPGQSPDSPRTVPAMSPPQKEIEKEKEKKKSFDRRSSQGLESEPLPLDLQPSSDLGDPSHVGTTIAPRKRAAPLPAGKTDSFASRVGARFVERHTAALGYAPVQWGAKANRQLAEWGKTISEEQALVVVDAFFGSPDPYYRSNAYPLALMIAQAAKLYEQGVKPRAYAEQVAAVTQRRQHSTAASNELAYEEFQRRKAEREPDVL